MKCRATVPPMNPRSVSVRLPENLNRRCTLTLSPSGGDSACAEESEKHPRMRQTNGSFTVQLPLDADAEKSLTDAHTVRYSTFCIYHSPETDSRRGWPSFSPRVSRGRPSLSLLVLERQSGGNFDPDEPLERTINDPGNLPRPVKSNPLPPTPTQPIIV